jgi:hypothetical protein
VNVVGIVVGIVGSVHGKVVAVLVPVALVVTVPAAAVVLGDFTAVFAADFALLTLLPGAVTLTTVDADSPLDGSLDSALDAFVFRRGVLSSSSICTVEDADVWDRWQAARCNVTITNGAIANAPNTPMDMRDR